jgi:hypothetical protein
VEEGWLTPKPLSDVVRTIYSGPSESNPNIRVVLCKDHVNVDKVEFERQYTRIDFDLDARPLDDLAHRVQRYRVDSVWDMLEKVYECGIVEGKRQVRETLREVIGL